MVVRAQSGVLDLLTPTIRVDSKLVRVREAKKVLIVCIGRVDMVSLGFEKKRTCQRQQALEKEQAHEEVADVISHLSATNPPLEGKVKNALLPALPYIDSHRDLKRPCQGFSERIGSKNHGPQWTLVTLRWSPIHKLTASGCFPGHAGLEHMWQAGT